MDSGVKVNDECLAAYRELKDDRKYRYVIYKVNQDNTEIITESKGERDLSYDEFKKAIPADDCRYIVYDLEYKDERAIRSKLIFFSWCPEGASTHNKMLHAASLHTLRKMLDGVSTEIQCTEWSEIDIDEVTKRFTKVTQ